eukprot:1367475-Rhodomonas_salina.1
METPCSFCNNSNQSVWSFRQGSNLLNLEHSTWEAPRLISASKPSFATGYSLILEGTCTCSRVDQDTASVLLW